MTRLLHGGRLHTAAERYGRPVGEWLDLSCALNPEPWPVPVIPQQVFARLPEDDDGLPDAAARFYGSSELLMLPGTQAAIANLPCITPGRRRVWVPQCGYAEHAHCWSRAGHHLQRYQHLPSPAQLEGGDVVVCIRPHNPLADCATKDILQTLQLRLASLDGLLVADEAFIDVTPEASLITDPMPPHLVVLRSFGKFFGLAGLRLGCMIAAPFWLQRMEDSLEPWSINTPARFIARMAYSDTIWHAEARQRLPVASARLSAMLTEALGLSAHEVHACALFVTLDLGETRALSITDGLARQGILVRLFAEEGLVRWGLPTDTGARTRLQDALLRLGKA